MRLARSLPLIPLLLLAVALPSLGQDTPGPAAYNQPLSPSLEGWPAPYPVKFLPLNVEGQDVRMAYMDVPPANGNGNGRAVVLLHGKNFWGDYWQGTADALGARGYRVVIPDQIGFGRSSKPEINYSFDLLASATAKLLDELKIDRAAIVGHSMGGMLAVRLARNYPDRVSQLVLANPIGLEDYRFAIPYRRTQQAYEGELATTDPGRIRAFYRRYVVAWDPGKYEKFVEVRSRIPLSGEYPRYCMASALTYQMIYQQPVLHEFKLIEAPTLLIIGQEDRTTLGRGFVSEDVLKNLGDYPRLGKEAARDIPGAKLVELENVGHLPMLEAPEKFDAVLLEFLR